MPALLEARRLLLQSYQAALAAVDGRRCVARRLSGARDLPAEVSVVAVGKAAAAMARGAAEGLGARLRRSLVITRHGYGAGVPPGAELLEAGHPEPDVASLRAGARLLEFVAQTPVGHGRVFLLSGGASALVEVLPSGIGLEDLQRANAWLLRSGLDITAINAVRQRLSCLKGGRLARRLHGQPALALLISDVPGDDPAVIGSGPLTAPPVPAGLPSVLPDWLQALLEHAPPLPAPGDLGGVRTEILADNRTALEAAAVAARHAGQPARVQAAPLSGDAATCGRALARTLSDAAPGMYLWGGETTVRLPAMPGRGGRNQQLALAAAEVMAGRSGLWLLAGASDGSDGSTEDAGALVDGGTRARGEATGLDAAACLRGADAGRFLAASGDLLHTGPTGTNVMDLVLGLRRG